MSCIIQMLGFISLWVHLEFTCRLTSAHHDDIIAWYNAWYYWYWPFARGIPEVSNNELSWWRHQMETFSALLASCAGNSPVPGEFPAQRSVTRSFDAFLHLRLNKGLSKRSWGWWFETPSRPLWRHRNGLLHCCQSEQAVKKSCCR